MHADDFSCPHCHKFSYFCSGNFHLPAASLWFQAVVGFEDLGDSKTHGRLITVASAQKLAGVATLRCPHPSCGKLFSQRVAEAVVSVYREHARSRGLPKTPSLI